MGWPQITLIALIALSLGVHLAKHGERRPDYNIWYSLISASISCWLLYSGGFFKLPA